MTLLPRIKLASVLLALSMGSVYAQTTPTTPIKPEQVLDWYLSVAFNDNVASAKAINDYMRPAYGEEDFMSIADVESARANRKVLIQNVSERIASQYDEQDKVKVQQAAAGALNRQHELVAQAQCKSVASTVTDDSEGTGVSASVKYECTIAGNVALVEQPADESAESIYQMFTQQKANFDAVSGTQVVSGVGEFYATDKVNPVWMLRNPSELPMPVIKALTPTSKSQ